MNTCKNGIFKGGDKYIENATGTYNWRDVFNHGLEDSHIDSNSLQINL